MKQLALASLIASSLFANYAHQGENSGKIDMHGGKSDSLLNKKSNFSKGGFSLSNGMGLGNTQSPKNSKDTLQQTTKTNLEKTTK